MADTFRSYLELLGALREKLEQLSELARQKTDAVRNDDLVTLDEIRKQEQALALSFRGLDQKRTTLLREMGAEELSLSDVAGCFPAAMRTEAKQAVEALQSQYRIYRTGAEIARNTLEVNLHEIEKILAASGGAPVSGAGYTPPAAEPPKTMKTDFRA